MVWTGKAVHSQHAQHGRERRKEDCHFKSDGNECGPTVKWPTANVYGVRDYGAVVLQRIATQSADDSTNEHNQRHACAMEAYCIGQTFDGHRRIGFHATITGFANVLGSRHEG